MINEAYIEGQKIDLSEDFSTLITYSVDDVKEFAYRNTSKALECILPGTKKNNIIFGGIFDVKNSNSYNKALPNIGYNFNAAVGANIVYFQDKIQVFKGIVRLKQIVTINGHIEYECSLIGELGGFTLKLGSAKIEQLNFSAYDLQYSYANIIASWNNTGGAGLWFGLMDYGNYSNDKKHWNYKTFRPALYLKEYIEKIISFTGYTVDFSLSNTPRFKSIVIPHNQKILTRQNAEAFNVKYDGTGGYSLSLDYSEGIYSKLIDLTTHIALGSFTTTDYKTYTYTGASITGKFYINVKGSVSSVINGNAFVNAKTTREEADIYLEAGNYDFDKDLLISSGINNGDVFEMKLNINDNYNDPLVSVSVNFVQVIFKTDAVGLVPVSLGENISINDCIPRNVLMIDFLKSVIRLFNLYVYEDKFIKNHLIIKPYIEFYSNESIDWSKKINRNKATIIKPMSENNSRYYNFSYKLDSDFWNELYSKRYNENYGSYKFDSEFEFANAENSFELIFSGTPLVGYTGEDKVYSTIYKRNGNGTTSSPYIEEQIDSNIRLLQTKKITGVNSWNIVNELSYSMGSNTCYPYAGHFDDPDAPSNDLNFGVPKELFFSLVTGAINVNQFNVYWSSYMAEITDKNSKLLICSAFLNEFDIYNLNFQKFIHIDGANFKINSIIDYNSSKRDECKLELLKVINTDY